MRSSPVHRCLSFAVALCVAAATPIAPRAHAGPGAAEREKRDTARRYVDAGLAAEKAKDYAAAVDFYLRAYDLVPHPLLIFNMAEAHRLADHPVEALAHYRRYLAADPSGPRAKAASDKVPTLEAAVAAQVAEEARRAEALRMAESARRAEELRMAEAARDAQAAQVAEQQHRALAERRREEAERALAVAADRARVKRRGDNLRLAGLSVGVAGVAGLALGAYFGRRAATLSDEVSSTYDAQQLTDGEDAERAQIISLAVGGALTATGAVLLYLGWRKGRAGVAVAPAPGGDGAALTFAGGW